MFNLFNKHKKEKEAERLYKIYKNIDVTKRIKYIANNEFKRMLIDAEKVALNGQTSLSYTLSVNDEDVIYINRIIYAFISLINEEGFRYSRQLVGNQKTFMIYFSDTK